MNSSTMLFAVFCCLVVYVRAENSVEEQSQGLTKLEPVENPVENVNVDHTRPKRTLLLKKKLLGAGILGFGLGIAKGYKAGYRHGPEVHHVYIAPPPPSVKYVEYVEKPVFVERYVERPVYKHSPDYEPSWSPEPSSPYGSW